MVKLLLAILVLLAVATGASAQLSPGDLHQSHAFLEGVRNCTRCHGGDQELVPDKCLACHGRISAQRETGKGLHSRPEYQECQTCHVEHHGRDFELIYWKDSESSFDHNQTGFRLEGKHASVACRSCHKPQFIGSLALGAEERIDSSRTYLGLEVACVACHRDEHRGQLSENCTTCHSQTAWKPVDAFDHATAKFDLTGKHKAVACIRCHQLMTDRPQATDFNYLKFTGLAFAQCTACHSDVHVGKLGGNCGSCHTTEGWFLVNSANFDHSRTRYPLEGEHAKVDCTGCHKAGQSKSSLAFGACRDCHADFHRGQLAARESKGNCEECHTVKGFTPANFLMAQHEQTDYPLWGAHRAVPCLACHNSTEGNAATNLNFVYESTRCQACHKDPHRGQVDKLVAADGCELCHVVETWNRVNYDHSKSNFVLEGKHTKVACGKCHNDIASTGEIDAVRFTGIRADCQSCHTDIHQGQFALENQAACARCHTPSSWKPSIFDHATSRFKLDGAHRAVACGKCHPATPTSQGPFVKYKPLEISCASCHGTTFPERSSRP